MAVLIYQDGRPVGSDAGMRTISCIGRHGAHTVARSLPKGDTEVVADLDLERAAG